MSALRSQFIDRLNLKGFSPRTVDNYVAVVAGITRHFRISPLVLSSRQIQAYLLFLLQSRKLAPATVNLHMNALKTFYSLMMPGSAIMDECGRVKNRRHLPLVLSRQEISRMIEKTTNIKHRAILMVLYSAGLRLMECINLRPCHIESQRRKIRVEQGKGKADRYTVLADRTLETLRLYYKAHHPQTWLFMRSCRGHGEPRPWARIRKNPGR